MHIISYKLELCTKAVPVHLDLMAALIQTEFQCYLAGLQCVHIIGMHGQHLT